MLAADGFHRHYAIGLLPAAAADSRQRCHYADWPPTPHISSALPLSMIFMPAPDADTLITPLPRLILLPPLLFRH